MLWKVASSLDGRIALANGQSRWITGARSRARVHELRADSDAVVTGMGTVTADDPELTARDVALRPQGQPLRVVVGRIEALRPDSRLMQTLHLGPVLGAWPDDVRAEAAEAHSARAAMAALGLHLQQVRANGQGGVDPLALLQMLSERGVSRVMLESGGRLAAAFLRAGLIRRIAWFRSGMILGGDARPAVEALGLESLDLAVRYQRIATEDLGADTLDTYVRVHVDEAVAIRVRE